MRPPVPTKLPASLPQPGTTPGLADWALPRAPCTCSEVLCGSRLYSSRRPSRGPRVYTLPILFWFLGVCTSLPPTSLLLPPPDCLCTSCFSSAPPRASSRVSSGFFGTLFLGPIQVPHRMPRRVVEMAVATLPHAGRSQAELKQARPISSVVNPLSSVSKWRERALATRGCAALECLRPCCEDLALERRSWMGSPC